MESESLRPTHAGILSTDLRPFFSAVLPSIGTGELIVDLRNHSHPTGSRLDQDQVYSGLFGDACEKPEIQPLALSIREIESLHLLFSGLSHDLNNLLQVATSALSLIEKRSVSGREADINALIEKAELALDRAKTVVRRLILLPVHPCGQFDELDVNETIKSMLSLFSFSAGPGIDVSLDLTPQQLIIACDSLDFENALLNLVTNSKNAISNEGEIVIKTSVELRPPTESEAHERSYAVVTISDNGHGMTEDVAARAFDPFYSTRVSRGGTGLGLAMVRWFLSEVKGESKIESTVGSGTSISLIIPTACPTSANKN